MKKGFFLNMPQEQACFTVPRCEACKLHEDCRTPKMKPTGEGKKKVLFVAEAPGASEDKTGIQLIGLAGQLLRDKLESIGWDLDRDCWKTNAIICRPPDNRTPTKKEIDACRPYLLKTIKKLQPTVVVLLGSTAVSSLIGSVWNKRLGAMGRWTGWQIPLRKLNLWACPIWHPSYLLREKNKVLELWFERYLKEVLELSDAKPWEDGTPDYKRHITRTKDYARAAEYIREFKRVGRLVAFDYETNMLKPDSKDARIVSCAVSDGNNTIAYPWVGEAIVATSELLRSRIPKIGANIKFEERWTRKILGHGVRNWKWDCIQAAHVLNNESGITSLKFQAFVRLGVEDYDSHITSYFESDGQNSPNRIKEINLSDLLLYNGMDALLEYKIAERQMVEM